MEKKQIRIRRATRTRSKIRELNVFRLSVHRSAQHIYAQVMAPGSEKVIAQASTLDKDLRKSLADKTGNVAAAQIVGKLIAERAKKAGVTKVAFDRSGFKYHGRVKALAEAARENGMEF